MKDNQRSSDAELAEEVLNSAGLGSEALQDLLGEALLGEAYTPVREARRVGEHVRRDREIEERVLDEMIRVCRTEMAELTQEARVGLFASALLSAMETESGKRLGILSVFGLAIERLATLTPVGDERARRESLAQATPEGVSLRTVRTDR
jgi:hypothetical protein